MDRFRDYYVRGVLILALLLPVYFLIAALGTKFHMIDWRVGFGTMTVRWGPLIMMGVAALALIGLVMAWFTPPRRYRGRALIALLIPLAGIGYGLYVRQQAQSIPPLHDISTDPVDPPGFSAEVIAARARVPDHNDLELLNARLPDNPRFGRWSNMRTLDVQAAAYSDIGAIPTGLPPQVTFDAALALAREQGWTIGTVNAGDGIIEATEESLWYGFVDDIVIRVSPDGSGARVDMRSVSRVGLSDLGANAKRMRPYLTELRRRLEEAESR